MKSTSWTVVWGWLDRGRNENQKYWKDYFNISEQADLSQYVYLCVFEHNENTSNYEVNAIAYYDSGNYCTMIRKNFQSAASNVTADNTNYAMYATQGTVVTIYKIEP